ncbi:MAG: ABC transporter ATP-binding protein [Propionibacteriaceae bacterium]|nr:ABC transporter ATP-binding protein [Propionibacteriaceae bacterium]
MTALLSVKDLHVTFPSEAGQVQAVRGLSFDLERGQTMGLVGESGSGKSVTSLAIMGLHPETTRITGSVKLDGQELLGKTDTQMSAIRGNKIAMVFQDPLSALTPVYTVGDQIVEAILVHRDVRKADAWKRAVELLDAVGIPNAKQRAKAYPFEFSGGMRQRVMIAMAMANDPDLIIADEPTTALDVTIQAQVLEVLRAAQQETGAAMILITHDLGVVAGTCDMVTVMYAGRPIEQGSVDDIFYAPRMPYTIGLLGTVPSMTDRTNKTALPMLEGHPPSLVDLPPGCPFEPRCPMAVDACRTDEPEPAVTSGDEASHKVSCHRADEIAANNLRHGDIFPIPTLQTSEFSDVPRDQRDSVLRLDALKKTFPLLKGAIYRRKIGEVRAVDGIDLDIRQGETLGLVGESGSGKTTTLMEILELVKPESGTISILGHDTSVMHPKDRRALRRDIQVVFQDPMAAVDPRMPVFDIIAEPLGAFGYTKEQTRSRVFELLKLVGLEAAMADRYPQHFSGGQRQRIGIARALALQPKVLVLDEPVSALDVSIQAGVINLLEDLQGKLGLSYLLVAHDLAVIRHICDRVAVMYLGSIVEAGSVEAIYAAPTHPYTQALISAIPIPDPNVERARRRIVLQGDLPNPAEPPSGCKFHTRCPLFETLTPQQQKRCTQDVPTLTAAGEDHTVACFYGEARAML